MIFDQRSNKTTHTLQNSDPFQEFKELIEAASVPWFQKVLLPLEKATKLYEDLLKEKDKRIQDLEHIISLSKSQKKSTR